MANGVKGRTTKYIAGSHNVTCDRTGRVYKRSDMRYEWNGLLVYKGVWEAKHPQLDLKPKEESIAVNDVRSEGPNYYPTPVNASDL